ncbi:Protein FecR [compost metagenome]
MTQARQSWSKGVLLADDMPLGAFVQELSHYRHGHLAVAPEVADLRVVGSYPLHDSDQALAMLEGVLPIRVNRLLPWWVTLEPR